MSSLIGQSIRGYQFRQQIGEGGFGIVYRAYQSTIDREVAIKIILPELAHKAEFRKQFEAEARLIARLEHPNIVPLYDYWYDDHSNCAFLVMRWVRGGTLRDMLNRQGALPLAQAARIFNQMAEALSVAHQGGVVHCDLKPENILLDERSNAYLTDFGIARQLDATAPRGGNAVDEMMTGTLAYVSPEQIEGEAPSQQSDIYSLGIMLYQMLTGRYPYRKPGSDSLVSVDELLNAHLTSSLPLVSNTRPDLPSGVDQILQKATSKDPRARYADVLEFDSDLRNVQESRTGLIGLLNAPIPKPTRRPFQTAADRNRHAMIQNVRSFWVEGVLDSSLHNTMLIALNMQERDPGHPWELQVHAPDRMVPVGIGILHIYDKLNGKLLILGNPGGGKTIMLLELARDLLDRAEGDLEHPIPVVLNLSSWMDNRKGLEHWLVEELAGKYHTPRRVARDWVADDRLLLLLDGLDEVRGPIREACVDALNMFRERHTYVDMVVCSRIADYEALTNRLNLNGAIMVQPLSDAQVDDYLLRLGPPTAGLRDLLDNDEALRELSRTPLMLSILALTYQNTMLQPVARSVDVNDVRRSIFGNYVERSFRRRPADTTYTREQTIHYLSWLAAQMQQHTQSIFQIEGLQSSWLSPAQLPGYYRSVKVLLITVMALFYGGWRIIDSGFQDVPVWSYGGFGLLAGALWGWILSGYHFKKLRYAVLPGIVLGIGWGLSVALSSTLREGLIRGLISITVNSFMMGTTAILLARTHNDRDNISPIQKLRFSLKRLNPGILIASIIVSVLYFAPQDLTLPSLIACLLSSAMAVATAVVIMCLVSDKVEVISRPNEGIRRSLSYGMRAGVLIAAVTFLFFIPQAAALTVDRLARLADGVTAMVTMTTGALLVFGLFAVLHHVMLRRVLTKSGAIPQNYAHFLDYATQLILIRKVGGSFIFIHRYLLEYFATPETAADLEADRVPAPVAK